MAHTKINIFDKLIIHSNIFNINSIICFDNSLKCYYTILKQFDNKWLLINDHLIPSVQQIRLNDISIVTSIMHECILIIYFNNKICN